jgi:plasmid stabilization system protein ParE
VRVTRGDIAAVARRLDEIDALIADIAANPTSGVRLPGDLSGWLVRHGGRGRRLTIVFRADPDTEVVYIAVIAFGGRDWTSDAGARRGPGSSVQDR